MPQGERGRVVVAVGPQVQPGQVRRLERPHPGVRQVPGEQLAQQRPLRVEPLDQRLVPVVAVGPRDHGRDHAERRVGVVLRQRDPAQPRLLGRVEGHDLRAVQARGVERLGRAGDEDAALVDREVRRERGAGQHQRPVDLVGDHAGVVPPGEGGQRDELVGRRHPAERVVRVAEQQRAGAGPERVLDRGQVERGVVGVRVELDGDQLAAGDGDDVAERRVAGERHHDRPGRAEHLEGDPDAGDHVPDHDRRVGGRTPRPVPVGVPGQRGADAAVPERRVARRAAADRRGQRVHERRRQRVVHLRHPGRHHARLDGSPLQRECRARFLVAQVHDHRGEPSAADRAEGPR